MSDALEALERLIREMKRFPRLYELPRFPIDEAEDALANIRAALEQGEAVEYWVLFDASGGQKFIKKEVGSGVLAFFDDEFAAKAAKRANPGTDYQRVVYYKSPPSTAEAQARALIEFSIGLKQQAQQTHSMFSEGLLHAARYAEAEAKRIREEGK